MTARRPRTLLAIVVALALAACTGSAEGPDEGASPEPTSTTASTPPPTRSRPPVIAVVTPRGSSLHPPELARQKENLLALADELMSSGRAADVRILVPAGTATLDEVVESQADLGADLVCAIGPRALRVVLTAAANRPGTRFCATPAASSDVPENVLAVQLRIQEQAFLAGVAAGLPRGSTPGAVLRDAGLVDRLRDAFEGGLRLVRDLGDQNVGLGLVADEDQARTDAIARYETGIFTLWTRAGRSERGVLQAAQEQQRVVVGSLEWLAPDPEVGEVPPPWTLMLQGEDYSVAIRAAFEHLEDGWTGGAISLGFAEGVFVIEGGGSTEWNKYRTEILQKRDAIADGVLTIPS